MISIVDDDASVRAASNRLVRSLGYVAYPFASAREFLESSQVNDTSCLIADVQMPAMSGLELQSLLRAQGRALPIIFITAFPEESVRKRALDAGAICFQISRSTDRHLLNTWTRLWSGMAADSARFSCGPAALQRSYSAQRETGPKTKV